MQSEKNPWLLIPASDYEGHMGSSAVQQLGYLSAVFREVLEETRPQALAVPGATTGNGFEHLPPETRRIVAIDVNPEYVSVLRDRFAGRLPGLETRVGDLCDPAVAFEALDLVHCALVLEYVPPEEVVPRFASWLRPGGAFSVVLQLPMEGHAPVTETPYASVKVLEPLLRLVDPERMHGIAAAAGLVPVRRRIDTLPTGKRFFAALYRRPEVEIVSYDPAWPIHFEAERRALRGAFAPAWVAIEHVGSTAVPGLAAKPIIDILLGCERLAEVEARIDALRALDYRYVPDYEDVLPERRYFVKPVEGPRRVHLHAVERTTPFWTRHVLFRDFLRAHPATAVAYEALKRRLAAEHPGDRMAYTEAKSEFIEEIVERALRGRGAR